GDAKGAVDHFSTAAHGGEDAVADEEGGAVKEEVGDVCRSKSKVLKDDVAVVLYFDGGSPGVEAEVAVKVDKGVGDLGGGRQGQGSVDDDSSPGGGGCCGGGGKPDGEGFGADGHEPSSGGDGQCSVG